MERVLLVFQLKHYTNARHDMEKVSFSISSFHTFSILRWLENDSVSPSFGMTVCAG